jgi:hypothetical protein
MFESTHSFINVGIFIVVGKTPIKSFGKGFGAAVLEKIHGIIPENRQILEAFLRMTRDPWYQTIGEYLLGKQTEDFLKKQAGGSPENLITVSTALGFWAEGSGEKDKAIKYYNEALGTFLDTWREYDFAKARLKRLKTPSG